MKKLMALLTVFCMMLCLFAGCGNAETPETTQPVQTNDPAPVQTTAPA